jgi:hypothetical protein
MRKLISMLSAVVVLGMGLIPAANAFTLSLVPQSSVVSPGGTLLVDVIASDLAAGAAPSLGAFDLSVSYDAAILSFGSVAFGAGLDVLGLGSFQEADASALGLVNAFELSFDTTADLNTLQPGTFTLFTITFSAASAGTSLLGLSVNSLSSAEGTGLVADALNGASVSVAPVPLPAAVWMLLSGLAGTGLLARRRRQSAE